VLSDDEDDEEDDARQNAAASATIAPAEEVASKVDSDSTSSVKKDATKVESLKETADSTSIDDIKAAEGEKEKVVEAKKAKTVPSIDELSDLTSSRSSSGPSSIGALLAQMNRPRKKKKKSNGKSGMLDQSIARLLKGDDETPSVDRKAASEAARAALANAGKMKIQEEKHFAGQTISVMRTLDKDSAEAKEALAKAAASAKQSELDKIVTELKNPKKGMTAIEKSSYDWEQFKEDKGIGEQLEAYAKDGYVEKQQFLQRVEERQFEAGRAERERARAMAAAAAARNAKK